MKKEELTSRERVRMSLNHQEPDRVPRDLGGTPVSTITLGAYDGLREYLAGSGGPVLPPRPVQYANRWGQTVRPDPEILERFSIDTRPVYLKAPRYWRDMWYQGGNLFVDEWGVLRQRSSPDPYHYFDVVGNPLADINGVDDLKGFRWPLGNDPGRVEGLREEAKYLFEHTSYALIGNLPGTDIFELYWFLRGFENCLMDLLINKELAHVLLRTITDIQMQKFELYLDAVGEFIDVCMFSDDLAMQNSLIVSPGVYREMIKPYQRELAALIRSKTDAKIVYHTDGAVRPLIEDLIEIGVDILQPVQVSAKGMESGGLKKDFGDRISFWGGTDNQQVLASGSPDDVREDVDKRMADFKPGGGYIFSAGHNIQFDVPSENIVTLYDYSYEAGWYI